MDLEKEASGNSFEAGKKEGKTEFWKLEALVDWELELLYFCDLFHLLYIEGKVLPTSEGL